MTKEEKAAYARKWRLENPEKTRQQSRKHYLKHAEVIKRRAARYRKEHPEKVKMWQRAWRKKNREKRKMDGRTRYWKDPAISRLYLRQLAHKYREKVIKFLGGVCRKCGYSDLRALQIDHVFGGGTRELRKLGSRKYRKIYEDKTGSYQLLCANCNWIKRWENEEYGTIVARQPQPGLKISS